MGVGGGGWPGMPPGVSMRVSLLWLGRCCGSIFASVVSSLGSRWGGCGAGCWQRCNRGMTGGWWVLPVWLCGALENFK